MKALRNFFDGRPFVLSGVVLLVAVSLFNNWLLAFLLNRRLLFSGGSISELSVHSQPHALIFETLDVLSGILFALFAILIKKTMPKLNRSGHVLVWGTFIFGIANSVDALLTLPCSVTLDRGCNLPITINWSHFNFPSHGYSSVLIALSYFVLPLAGLFYAKTNRLHNFERMSILALLVALASFISAAWQYLNLHDFSVKASGWAQGIQMLVLAWWFISWYLAVTPKTIPKKTK